MIATRTTSDLLTGATVESIHRFGLAETTVTRVTDIAGVSRGMVRHVFGSKHEMLVATMASLVEEWTLATEPDDTLAPPDQVRSIVRAMFAVDVFTDARVDAWLAFTSAASSNDDLARLCQHAYAAWTGQLERSFAASDVQQPRLAAQGMLAAGDGLWLRHRLEPKLMTRETSEAAALAVAEALLR